MSSLRFLLVYSLCLLALTMGSIQAFAGPTRPGAGLMTSVDGPSTQDQADKSQSKQVLLKGRVDCFDAQGQLVPVDKDCGEAYRLVFHDEDGHDHAFVSNDALGPMLADPRVRRRTLRLIALQHSDGHLEALTVQSIKDGKVFDIYYFCQLCNITTYTPGLCPCCRQELEFKEAPATGP